MENNSSSWITVCTSHPYLFLAVPGMPHLTYNNNSKLCSLYTSPGSIYTSCLTHANVTQLNLTMVFVVHIQTETWLPVNVTHKWEDPGGLAPLNCALSQVRVWCFLGTHMACIVSAIIIAAIAAVAATALAECNQTGHAVDANLTNTPQEMIQQTGIDQEILVRLSAIKSVVIWLGEWQDALVTCQQLTCDPDCSKLCVTSLKWNSSQQHSWEGVQDGLWGTFPPISKDKSINSSLGNASSFGTLNDSWSRSSFIPCIITYKDQSKNLL